MADKIYLASIKERLFPDGGSCLNVSFGPKDFEILQANRNEKGWVNLKITKRREQSEYGQTHSMVIDDWRPDTTQARQGINRMEKDSAPLRDWDEEQTPF